MGSEAQMHKRPAAADDNDDDDGVGGPASVSEPARAGVKVAADAHDDDGFAAPAVAEVKAVPKQRRGATRPKASKAATLSKGDLVKDRLASFFDGPKKRPAGKMVQTKANKAKAATKLESDKTPQQKKKTRLRAANATPHRCKKRRRRHPSCEKGLERWHHT